MRNLEIFDAYATYVVGKLHDAFPIAKRLDHDDVVAAVKIEAQAGENLNDYALGTLKWLLNIGLLISEDPSDQRNSDLRGRVYTLSPQAFAVMRLKMPPSLEKKVGAKGEATFGDGFRKLAGMAVKKGAEKIGEEGGSLLWGEILGQLKDLMPT